MTEMWRVNNKKHHVVMVRFVGVWLWFRNREGANAPNTSESIYQWMLKSRNRSGNDLHRDDRKLYTA
jgi:hypothetical protein